MRLAASKKGKVVSRNLMLQLLTAPHVRHLDLISNVIRSLSAVSLSCAGIAAWAVVFDSLIGVPKNSHQVSRLLPSLCRNGGFN